MSEESHRRVHRGWCEEICTVRMGSVSLVEGTWIAKYSQWRRHSFSNIADYEWKDRVRWYLEEINKDKKVSSRWRSFYQLKMRL